MRFVEPEAGPETETLPSIDLTESYIVGPAHVFGLERAFASNDELGRPAIGFEITESDAAAFTELTANHIGDLLAIVVEGQVISVAKINGILPGGGQIYGNFTPEYVEDLVASMRGSTAAR
jgi:preprotein translocase subunit SecD